MQNNHAYRSEMSELRGNFISITNYFEGGMKSMEYYYVALYKLL